MKKGQAAMEFLMTYGWAILVVIAAIAALAYFGVLDPARLLPERCQFPAGMDCIDKASVDGTADTITVALRNNVAFAVTVDDINVTGASCTGSKEVSVGGGAWVLASTSPSVPNNGDFRIRFSTCGLTVGDKFDGTVTVSYTNTESSLENKALGDVRGRVA